mmetsp:Transcript_75149/g.199587  ORF Transcript_75149/g.199587 Transcript_75149/m.199587 type:complete len:201 (+) Transcript_75149:558-1160(+)
MLWGPSVHDDDATGLQAPDGLRPLRHAQHDEDTDGVAHEDKRGSLELGALGMLLERGLKALHCVLHYPVHVGGPLLGLASAVPGPLVDRSLNPLRALRHEVCPEREAVASAVEDDQPQAAAAALPRLAHVLPQALGQAVVVGEAEVTLHGPQVAAPVRPWRLRPGLAHGLGCHIAELASLSELRSGLVDIVKIDHRPIRT